MILNKKIGMALVLLGALAAPAAARVRVVASFSVLGDWARAVGGPDVELSVLVGPDGDSHGYEPTPADGRALSSAEVVLENGLGFEPWLDKLLAASGSRARVVRASDGVVLRRNGAEPDPHVWGDPSNAARAVEGIRDALVAADPPNADAYRRRAAAYLKELNALDLWIRERTSRVPPGRRLLVTTHDTLGYWADRYGFRVVDTLLSSFSTEAADPSAARLAALSDRIRILGVPAVFTERVTSDALARTVAASAGVRVAPALFTDALGAPGTPAGTYIGMMKYDTGVIVEALQ